MSAWTCKPNVFPHEEPSCMENCTDAHHVGGQCGILPGKAGSNEESQPPPPLLPTELCVMRKNSRSSENQAHTQTKSTLRLALSPFLTIPTLNLRFCYHPNCRTSQTHGCASSSGSSPISLFSATTTLILPFYQNQIFLIDNDLLVMI